MQPLKSDSPTVTVQPPPARFAIKPSASREPPDVLAVAIWLRRANQPTGGARSAGPA